MPEEVSVGSAVADVPSSSGETSGGSFHAHNIGESLPSEASEVGKDAQGNGEKPEQKHRELSRYERTKRERAAFRAEREAFQREREAFARERAQAEEAKKPKHDYTIAELKKYRGEWYREGKHDLVEAADKEIAVMQQAAEAERAARTIEWPRVGTPEHRAQWESAERELAEADPEFMRSGTRLDTRLREIMSGPEGNVYRDHPRGIIAAYHRAKMELLSADLQEMGVTNNKLQTELKRYQGLTGISGGAPARVGSGSAVESLADFQRLSTKDMRKHLLANVDRHGAPWF